MTSADLMSLAAELDRNARLCLRYDDEPRAQAYMHSAEKVRAAVTGMDTLEADLRASVRLMERTER